MNTLAERFKTAAMTNVDVVIADLAERLSREHTVGLAVHVEKNVMYLDESPINGASDRQRSGGAGNG